MKAGIIAAGNGSRLGAGVPKPLVAVGGQTLIERTMRGLIAAGADEIVFAINERLAGPVIDVVAALRLPVPVTPVVRTTPSPLHTLHALAPHLGDGPFVLCAVDAVVRPADLCEFTRRFQARSDLQVLLSYTGFVDDEDPLRIVVDGHGRVTGLGPAAVGSPYVTLGVYGMTPAIFPALRIALAEGVDRLRHFLAQLLDGGLAVGGHLIDKGIDVDRAHDVDVANAFVAAWGPSS